jgi:CheY-like chemotaxis protein
MTPYVIWKGGTSSPNRSQFPLPSIAIVDLHLPEKDGFDFLRWLGNKPQFRTLHVVVVTGIGRLQDVNRAYQMGAKSFLTKPIKKDDLQNLARAFPAHWTQPLASLYAEC